MAEERVEAEPQPDVAVQAPVATPVAPTTSFGGASGGASVASALRSGTMSPAGVLALQRMVGNQAIANVLARDPAPPAPAAPAKSPTATAAAAFTVEIPDGATNPWKLEVGKSSYVKGSLVPKGEVQFVAVESGTEASVTAGGSTGSGGAKVEETLTFEAGLKKLEASIGLTAKMNSKYPWAKIIAEGKAIGLGIEWEKMAETSVGAIEISGGFSGEGKVSLGGIDYIAKPKITITGKGEINWPKVLGKAAEEGIKEGVKEGTKAAARTVATEAGVTTLAVDGAAVGSAVAAIAVPLAAAVAMGFGVFQGMKNAKTGQEATGLGVVLRDQANDWAKNYARTLTSHSAKGPGAAEAEAQIAAIMAQTNAPREYVVAMINQDRGGYTKLREEALGIIKPRLFDEAVKAYEEGHKEEFGIVESIGEEWGTRGVFRKDLRQILMADTAVGGG